MMPSMLNKYDLLFCCNILPVLDKTILFLDFYGFFFFFLAINPQNSKHLVMVCKFLFRQYGLFFFFFGSKAVWSLKSIRRRGDIESGSCFRFD